LHPAQDEAEQPPQPEPEEEGLLELFPMPNCERRLVVSFALQDGQSTSGFEP